MVVRLKLVWCEHDVVGIKERFHLSEVPEHCDVGIEVDNLAGAGIEQAA
jgi:hypothetical protein